MKSFCFGGGMGKGSDELATMDCKSFEENRTWWSRMLARQVADRADNACDDEKEVNA